MKKSASFVVAAVLMAQSATASAAGTGGVASIVSGVVGGKGHLPLYLGLPHITSASVKQLVVSLTHVGSGQSLASTLPGIDLLTIALKR